MAHAATVCAMATERDSLHNNCAPFVLHGVGRPHTTVVACMGSRTRGGGGGGLLEFAKIENCCIRASTVTVHAGHILSQHPSQGLGNGPWPKQKFALEACSPPKPIYAKAPLRLHSNDPTVQFRSGHLSCPLLIIRA